MKTRRSPRNQDILFRSLFAPAPAAAPEAVEQLDLSTAWWLSARAKRQIERDRIAAARKAAIKKAKERR